MSQKPSLSVRPAAIAACAEAVAFAALGSNQASAEIFKKGTINTYKNWQGSTVSPFGCPETSTYGQVITIPAHMHTLNKFSFWWSGLSSGNSMGVRGEVYGSDGSKATGAALYESKRRKISYGDSAFHKETFHPAVLSVTPGAQYVLFASIDKDYERCTNNYTVAWASVDDTAYIGGTFVFQNSGGDESQWTTTPWNTAGIDSAFKAYLSP